MIYHNKFVLLSAAILALSACEMTTAEKYEKGLPIEDYPVNDTKPQASYSEDLLNCQVYATNKVPTAMQSYTTPTWTTTAYTNCSGYGYGVNCYTYGGDTYGGDLVTTDANEGLRNRVTLQCLKNMGWGWLDIPACPKGTQKSDLISAVLGREKSFCYVPGEGDTFYSGNL